ncbi:Fe-S cluster assembly ATPase SufC [candidate division WWE3 bacterium]|uniref:Fe-S cluster assembly ATPase SufC n=1 Tax=candidate division WWE3 bacterium TaxID=2053526 RepID=A0A955J3P3_UNCKA|nr:Fe-S cluster assembly ATPase SufC [candidate division WWE3 bacterium]
MLEIKDLKVSIEDKEILKGVNLTAPSNQVTVLMGPNGSGKSTLAQALMGHPMYNVVSGQVEFNGEDLLDMEPDERALTGVFLSFQYPSEVSGVTISNFLRLIYNKKHDEKLTPVKFRTLLTEKMELLDMDPAFMHRYLNEGFSGGEKKRMEMLQMLILEPSLAILDETDSGLDVDALKVVGKVVNYLKEKNNMSVLLITHYTRILKYIQADSVHVMQHGVITNSGGKELAHELEEKGFAPFGE